MSNNRHFCFVCFPPTVALLPNFSLSKNCLNIENGAAHKPGFLHTDIYVPSLFVRELSGRFLDKYTNPYLSQHLKAPSKCVQTNAFVIDHWAFTSVE